MRRLPRFASLHQMGVGAIGWLALGTAVLLHVGVILCFTFRWDTVAAITVIPFFLWAGAGLASSLLAWLILRNGFPLFAAMVWLVTGAFCCDESSGIVRLFQKQGTDSLTGSTQALHTATAETQDIIRVITFNCGKNRTKAAQAVEAFSPDLIFFQESPHYRFVHDLAARLYGEDGAFVYGFDCSIVGRGSLAKKSPNAQRTWTQATWTLPDGRQVELLNAHLHRAATKLSLWRPDTWKAHKVNRTVRKDQVRQLLASLLTTMGPKPAIVGGDFNAPPSDASFRYLRNYFTDSYPVAGAGLCNTYSNRIPAVRIDYLWTTPEIVAVHHEVCRSEHSDHRIVVCDFQITRR